MKKSKGYRVERIDSPAGQAMLASRGLTSSDLASAIAAFQKQEGVRIGTPIGVGKDGFFGSTRDGWHPDDPDAFKESLIWIPWMQILELLGRVPNGTTGGFLKPDGNLQ